MSGGFDRVRRCLVAGVAVAAVSLALGGCSQYYGYHPGWPPGGGASGPHNWAQAPGGLNNADRAKEGGANVLAVGAFQDVPIADSDFDQEALAINEPPAVPVIVRLGPADLPATADSTWLNYVKDALLKLGSDDPTVPGNDGVNIIAVQIGNEPNSGGSHFWPAAQYAQFFSQTAAMIRNDPQLNSSPGGLGLNGKIITAGLNPLHAGYYDAEAQCTGTSDPHYTCPATYIGNVLYNLTHQSWGQNPNGVSIHLYPGIDLGATPNDTRTAEIRMVIGGTSEYHAFTEAVDGRTVWVTESGSRTGTPGAGPTQNQGDIDFNTFWDLEQDSKVPYGVIGFTLNDVGWDDDLPHGGTPRPLYGVLDESNLPKPGLPGGAPSSGAYCRLAALANKVPSGC